MIRSRGRVGCTRPSAWGMGRPPPAGAHAVEGVSSHHRIRSVMCQRFRSMKAKRPAVRRVVSTGFRKVSRRSRAKAPAVSLVAPRPGPAAIHAGDHHGRTIANGAACCQCGSGIVGLSRFRAAHVVSGSAGGVGDAGNRRVLTEIYTCSSCTTTHVVSGGGPADIQRFTRDECPIPHPSGGRHS